ncbi:penicillin acylase family protein [Streptomyces sp. NPDC058686]|uniref:penicillin acylase family protein n=1 Tax=Streptomyces sp. NPDC058686 TaxID=3346599 RepID=UPI0036583D9E
MNPRAATAFEVPGLAEPVEILVDQWGVPHLYADSQDDLFLAQGVNAARDRLFQLDLWRRGGLGLLSEVFGERYVEHRTGTAPSPYPATAATSGTASSTRTRCPPNATRNGAGSPPPTR